MSVLTPQQITQWRRDGFLSPFPLLDAAELQACRNGVARFETWLGGPINGVSEMKWRTMPHLLMPWAAALARDPRILDIVADLLGPDLLLYTSNFFIKEPHSPTIAAWHQDSTYFGLEPKEALSVWIAVTDANEAAGCMESLSFGGKPRQLIHKSRVVEHSVNRGAQVIVEPLDEGTPVAMPLKAGSFSIHHGLCPHRSGPNTAGHRRIGLGFIYVPTHARQMGSIKTAALLVRGADRHGHFEATSWPAAEFDAQGLACHERTIGLYRGAYLEEEARHAKLSA